MIRIPPPPPNQQESFVIYRRLHITRGIVHDSRKSLHGRDIQVGLNKIIITALPHCQPSVYNNKIAYMGFPLVVGKYFMYPWKSRNDS
jgi:hypothetical protein